MSSKIRNPYRRKDKILIFMKISVVLKVICSSFGYRPLHFLEKKEYQMPIFFYSLGPLCNNCANESSVMKNGTNAANYIPIDNLNGGKQYGS